jgi:hypothetical protein
MPPVASDLWHTHIFGTTPVTSAGRIKLSGPYFTKLNLLNNYVSTSLDFVFSFT